MATWYGEFLDGSENLEVACDAASDQGVLQIGAAGNLGGSEKHRVMTHSAGTQTVPLVIPSSGARYVYGDFLWREQAGAVLSFRVTLNGQTIQLSGSQGQTTAGNTAVQWGRYQSMRQTNMLLFYFAVPSGGSISGQTVEFEVTNTGSPVELHGYVTDDFSGWSKGVYWPSSTGSTDFGTYGTPGTGDKTLSVATYFAELLPSGAPKGDLARYSGRGPRIDRAETVDFAAPEDHITAYVGAGAPFGAMWIGGGTSNALPVAAGVAALLKGIRPSATPAELAAALRTHALVEASMGTVPNDAWGRGKVRGYRAHFNGTAAPANEPPSASGVAQRIGPGRLRVDASASSDPEGEPLRFRWDFDYDGTWDVGPTSEAVLTQSIASSADWVKLEAADAKGRVAHAVIRVTDAVEVTSDAGTSADGGVDGGGGGTLRVVPGADSRLGPPVACGCGASGWLAPLGLLPWWRRRR